MRELGSRETGASGKMVVLHAVTRRKGARHAVYASPRPVVRLARQLGHRLDGHALAAALTACFAPSATPTATDAGLIHAGQGPTVMALLRDAAVSVLHRAGIHQLAARLRRHSQLPDEAVAFVIDPLPTGA